MVSKRVTGRDMADDFADGDMENRVTDKCEFCDGDLENRRVLARFRYMSETIYIENVPAWVCKRCGEQQFDAPVYKQLERIAQQRNQIQRVILFPWAEFETAVS